MTKKAKTFNRFGGQFSRQAVSVQFVKGVTADGAVTGVSAVGFFRGVGFTVFVNDRRVVFVSSTPSATYVN